MKIILIDTSSHLLHSPPAAGQSDAIILSTDWPSPSSCLDFFSFEGCCTCVAVSEEKDQQPVINIYLTHVYDL